MKRKQWTDEVGATLALTSRVDAGCRLCIEGPVAIDRIFEAGPAAVREIHAYLGSLIAGAERCPACPKADPGRTARSVECPQCKLEWWWYDGEWAVVPF